MGALIYDTCLITDQQKQARKQLFFVPIFILGFCWVYVMPGPDYHTETQGSCPGHGISKGHEDFPFYPGNSL